MSRRGVPGASVVVGHQVKEVEVGDHGVEGEVGVVLATCRTGNG